MALKTMLKKLFTKYAVMGANSASLRGCYEHVVPNVLIKKSISNTQQATPDKRK